MYSFVSIDPEQYVDINCENRIHTFKDGALHPPHAHPSGAITFYRYSGLTIFLIMIHLAKL